MLTFRYSAVVRMWGGTVDSLHTTDPRRGSKATLMLKQEFLYLKIVTVKEGGRAVVRP